MIVDLDELERLHDLAENGDADERLNASDGIRHALPGLIAEVRAARAFVQEVRETAEDMPPSDAYVGYAPLTHGRLTAALAKVPK